MTIHRTVIDCIPQTIEGQRYADDYEYRMTYYAVNVKREESTSNIILTTEYWIDDAEIDNIPELKGEWQ